jgi:hypothetical protein
MGLDVHPKVRAIYRFTLLFKVCMLVIRCFSFLPRRQFLFTVVLDIYETRRSSTRPKQNAWFHRGLLDLVL